MAVNKVDLANGETLVDLTGDSVTAETLAEGTTAHDASGNTIIGKMPTTNVLYTEQALTEAQKAQARENIGAQPVGNYLESTELTSAINTALAQAKASGEFDGADGKSAYAYAKDGGYTGTEADFSAKLAKEYSQPDWNANEGEPGHILNRPFYSDYKTETLLETTTLTADASFANFEGVAVLPGPLALQEGMICNVVYNGAAYTCTVKAADFQGLSCFAFGNQIVVTGENTGEPFTVCAFSEDSTAITGIYGGVFPVDGSTTFSMSIASITEIVTPVPEKYLTKARGQKKYTIDLDSSTTDVSVDTLMKMDAAEIQSVLTVIYEGLPHSASVEEMASETVSGTTFSSILFSVHLAYGETVTFQYHNFGEGSLEILRTGYNVQYNYHPDRCNLFVKRKGDPYPTWEAIDDKESAFPGIMLKSPGNKVFWITVDDSGNLTATEK